MSIRRLLLLWMLLSLIHTSYAAQVGAKFTLPLVSQDPSNLHGYRGSVWLQPDCFTGSRISLLFDAGFGHWWVNNSMPRFRSLSIYSLSPVLRLYITKNSFISPFVDLSIGAAWLSETHLADRRFGMHFAFQDEASLGVSFGSLQKLFLSLSALHYSNGSLAKTNAGITVPLLINLGYRF